MPAVADIHYFLYVSVSAQHCLQCVCDVLPSELAKLAHQCFLVNSEVGDQLLWVSCN